MNFKEIAESRNGAINKQGDRTYLRAWKVEASIADDQFDIFSDGGCPVAIGDAHPSDAAAWIIGIRLQQDAGAMSIWTLTADYSSEDILSPVARPPIIRGSFSKTTKVIQEDKDGLPVWNSALVPFDPGLEIDQSRLVLTIEVNYVNTFDIVTTATSLQDAVNDDDWTLSIAGTDRTFVQYSAKCTTVEWEEKTENAVDYIAARYVIEINPDKWIPVKVLDAGTMTLVGGTLKQIFDSTGNPVSQPVPLDGAGGQSAVAVYLDFRVYDTADFDTLIPL